LRALASWLACQPHAQMASQCGEQSGRQLGLNWAGIWFNFERLGQFDSRDLSTVVVGHQIVVVANERPHELPTGMRLKDRSHSPTGHHTESSLWPAWQASSAGQPASHLASQRARPVHARRASGPVCKFGASSILIRWQYFQYVAPYARPQSTRLWARCGWAAAIKFTSAMTPGHSATGKANPSELCRTGAKRRRKRLRGRLGRCAGAGGRADSRHG